MPDNRSSILAAAKSTLIGGAIFLIPGCIVFFVLAKAFTVLRSLAAALGSRLGIAGPLGRRVAGRGGDCRGFAGVFPCGPRGAPCHRPAVAAQDGSDPARLFSRLCVCQGLDGTHAAEPGTRDQFSAGVGEISTISRRWHSRLAVCREASLPSICRARRIPGRAAWFSCSRNG